MALPLLHADRELDCGGKLLKLDTPKIMGVLNVTPDSFSDGGVYYQANKLNLDLVLRRAEKMLAEGAAIIDVGGESTRPGAASVSLQQELDRVIPAIEAISQTQAIISVDTSTPEVMREAAKAGAGLINDVRALTRPGAVETLKDLGLPVCLMHMPAEPDVMQQNPQYGDIVEEVCCHLKLRVEACLAAGISSDKIILDPGFGFGKTLKHNLKLLSRLERLADLGYPLLVGFSRKSMIGQLLDKPVSERLFGTIAVTVIAIEKGASIVRCHDVSATADAVKVTSSVLFE